MGADNVSHLLRRAHFRAEGLFAEEVGAYGITARQKALLAAAHQHSGSTLNQLADAIALDRQSTADMVHRLVERGLLERRRSERDARAYAVSVTRQGADLLEAVSAHDDRVEERVLEPLPWEFRPLFVKCLRIMTGLEEGDRAGPGTTTSR